MTENTGRRLPVYLVLDKSASMTGTPIEAVRQGIKALVHELKGDPMAYEIAHLAVIAFDNVVTQVSPLADLPGFREPALEASGGTALGAALDALNRSIQADVRRSSATQKGDYRPLVFLLTDGQPTDDWLPPAQRLKALGLTVVACAAGPAADVDLLRQITENVIELKDLEPGSLRVFFQYVSNSIRVASRSVLRSPEGAPLALPEPPSPYAA